MFPTHWLQPQQGQGFQGMPQQSQGQPQGQPMQQMQGFVDTNMDGIDDRIFEAQQKQTELEMQAKMQSLQAKREQQYWASMKKAMMERQREATKQQQQAAQGQPAGQFGQQWNQFQNIHQMVSGSGNPRFSSPLAGDGRFERSYQTPEGSLPRNTAPYR